MLTRDHNDIDRGWAWVAATAAYLTMITNCITLYMGGVLYIALLDTFQEGKAKTSLVSALNTGLLCLLCKCILKDFLVKSILFYPITFYCILHTELYTLCNGKSLLTPLSVFESDRNSTLS